MVQLAKADWLALYGLGLFHLGCFWRFYLKNPYWYARGEALEQGFASSVLLGRCLRRHEVVDDPYYYPDYRALPFLSSYYPPHVIQAWIGSFLTLNQAWVVYWGTMVLHFLGASIFAYILLEPLQSSLTQLFGAVTLSYLPYSLKHNSSIV